MSYDSRRHRSVSQMSAWTSCQLAYKLKRLDKRPDPPATWTILGIAVHGALEDWERSGREINPEDAYLLHWDLALDKAILKCPDLTTWTRTPGTKSTERDLELRKIQGSSQLLRYVIRAKEEAHMWEPLILPDGQVAVELPFKINFSDDTPFFLTGYIDLVQRWKHDGSITVADYKTGKDDREDYRQLGAYRVALEDNFGLDVKFGRYWYSKLDRPSEWIDLSRYTKDYLLEYYSRLDRQIENATRENLFLPNPSKKGCLFCSVKEHCPEMRGR